MFEEKSEEHDRVREFFCFGGKKKNLYFKFEIKIESYSHFWAPFVVFKRLNEWPNALYEFVSMQSHFAAHFPSNFHRAENQQWCSTLYQLSQVTNFYCIIIVRKCSSISPSLVHFNIQTIFFIIFIEISRKQNISTFFLKLNQHKFESQKRCRSHSVQMK